MSDDDAPPIDPDSPWSPWVQTFVLPYLREPGLWPVLVALLGHVVVVLAVLLLIVFRDGNPFGAFIALQLVAGSVWVIARDVRARGRPGGVTWTLVISWGLAGATAGILGPMGVI